MKKVYKKQLGLLKEYGQESVKSGAHIGLMFYAVIIAFGVIVYHTM